jgi:hypothetical protein
VGWRRRIESEAEARRNQTQRCAQQGFDSRVSWVGFDSRSGAWGSNRPIATGWVQALHKILHLGVFCVEPALSPSNHVDHYGLG